MLSAEKLIKICSLYKDATLEEDMAKRIMLSIIPSVMSDTERFHTGGFDIKALRSAVNGAKDMVKYGAKACVDELAHYGNGLYSGDDNVYQNISNLKRSIRNEMDDNNYKEALRLCIEAFNDLQSWQTSYGGGAWAKIATTLYNIQDKMDFLELVRQEAMSKRDPKTDYPLLEKETMQEIIVLMNVFDGLAHNTASVMPNLVEQEQREKPQPQDWDWTDKEYHNKKYLQRIKTMMDAKEINDPFTVYKEIQDIIEQPQYRNLFGDYVSRIRQNPGLQQAKSLKEMKTEIETIKLRKAVSSTLRNISNGIDKLADMKDRLLSSSDTYPILEEMMKLVNSTAEHCYDLDSRFRDMLDNSSNTNKELAEKIKLILTTLAPLIDRINSLNTKAYNIRYLGKSSENDIISGVASIKKLYQILVRAIEQYL